MDKINGKFCLSLQHPEPKKLGEGTWNMSIDSPACFFDTNGSILAKLERAYLKCAGVKGFMLSGLEEGGLDKRGKRKYFCQEWWLEYV